VTIRSAYRRVRDQVPIVGNYAPLGGQLCTSNQAIMYQLRGNYVPGGGT
jgi:hypothetical protein